MKDAIETPAEEPEETDENAVGEFITPDDSPFELVIVAAQRSKQLTNGAHPRLSADTMKRKSTYIAVEESRQGLIAFTTTELTAKQSRQK